MGRTETSSEHSGLGSHFPFAAIVDLDELKLALVLNAVNPSIGGLLVRGPKGSGKTMAVRALAELLPDIEAVKGCSFHCNPRDPVYLCRACRERLESGKPLETESRPMRVVTLPLGATEDRLVGTLDVERVLKEGVREVQPGILAEANQSVLYVDEINLLPDHLVDDLLDAAASGWNVVERETISLAHPARFILVGTMNPEEGELRPQLLDRLAISVNVRGVKDAYQRVEIISRNLEFKRDPVGFRKHYEAAGSELTGRISKAKELLQRVQVPRAQMFVAAQICSSLGVDGQRPDIVIAETARTIAAWEGRTELQPSDILQAARFALGHRTRRGGFDPPATEEEVEKAFREAILGYEMARLKYRKDEEDAKRRGAPDGPAKFEPRPADSTQPASGDDAREPRDMASEGTRRSTREVRGPAEQLGGNRAGRESRAVSLGGFLGVPKRLSWKEGPSRRLSFGPELLGLIALAFTAVLLLLRQFLAAVVTLIIAVVILVLLFLLRRRGPSLHEVRSRRPVLQLRGGLPIRARDQLGSLTRSAASAGRKVFAGMKMITEGRLPILPWLRRAGTARSRTAGKRGISVTSLTRGRSVSYEKPTRLTWDVAFVPTIQAAAMRGERGPEGLVRVGPEDVRTKVRVYRAPLTLVLVLDMSGSMIDVLPIIAKTLPVLNREAYKSRDRVGVVAFKGDAAYVLTHPTTNLRVVAGKVRSLGAIGFTPLADGLVKALEVVVHDRRKNRDIIPIVILISDCKANIPLQSRASLARLDRGFRMPLQNQIAPAEADALHVARLLKHHRVPVVVITPTTSKTPQRQEGSLAGQIAAITGGAWYHFSYSENTLFIQENRQLEEIFLNVTHNTNLIEPKSLSQLSPTGTLGNWG